MIPFLLPFLMAAPAVVTVSDDADAAAYFAMLNTGPSNPERAKVNAVTKALKSAGIWAANDWFVFLSAETGQAGRVNLRKPSKSLTAVNGPTFVPNTGWIPDRTSAYLDLGELWQASGNLFAQNHHSMGVIVVAQSGFTGPASLLGNVNNNPRTSMAVTSSSGSGYRSADSSDAILNTNNSRLGHFAFSRLNSTTKRAFWNGSLLDETASTTVGLNTTNGQIGGSRGANCDDTLGLFYSGAGLTPAQIAQMHTIVRDNYLGPKGLMT